MFISEINQINIAELQNKFLTMMTLANQAKSRFKIKK